MLDPACGSGNFLYDAYRSIFPATRKPDRGGAPLGRGLLSARTPAAPTPGHYGGLDAWLDGRSLHDAVAKIGYRHDSCRNTL